MSGAYVMYAPIPNTRVVYAIFGVAGGVFIGEAVKRITPFWKRQLRIFTV